MEYNEKLNLLKELAFTVIEEEGLPRPLKIHYRRSLGGVKGSSAKCFKNLATFSYKILLNTTTAKFYEDENGRYRDRKNGKRYSKALVGEQVPFLKLVFNMAHEVAHIKFWDHTPEHKSYTKHIEQQLISKLSERGVIVGT